MPNMTAGYGSFSYLIEFFWNFSYYYYMLDYMFDTI